MNKKYPMKKLLLMVIACTFFSTINAQVQKGTIILGGDINFNKNNLSQQYTSHSSTSEADKFKTTHISISPQCGMFISEFLEVGLGIAYQQNKSKYIEGGSSSYDDDNQTVKTNQFLIYPYITKYGKIAEKLYFTSTLKVQFGFGKHDDGRDRSTSESDISVFNINASPGLTYFISNKWSLKCTIGQLYYNRTKYSLDESSDYYDGYENIDENLGLNLDLNTFTIGFQYVLNNKS